SITTYTDVDEHGNDTKDGGVVTLTLKVQKTLEEQRASFNDLIQHMRSLTKADWNDLIENFLYYGWHMDSEGHYYYTPIER
ncbi:hypothetical protein KAT51_04305, partial [bacterium]|nr:hypothetical protein [bacterium]